MTSYYEGTYSNRSNQGIRLVVYEDTIDAPNNRSIVHFELHMILFSGVGSYANDPSGNRYTNINGNTRDPGGFAFNTQQSSDILLDTGSYWVTHDGAGNGTIGVSAATNNVTVVGSASTSGGFNLAHIVQLPPAPTFQSVTPTGGGNVTTVFTGNGGEVTLWILSYADNSSFTNATEVGSSGTDHLTLTPGKQYWFRACGSNSTGRGPWSNVMFAFVGIGGKRWDGSNEVSFSQAMRWDGSQEIPLTIAKRWDGSQEVDLI